MTSPIYGLHQVAQHAEDLERAPAFYVTHLGARVLATFDPPGLLFLQIGTARVLFEQAAPSATLYFRVDDVDATVTALRSAGVTIDTEPHTIFSDDDGLFGEADESERMAFIRDSEGNLVGLASRGRL